MTDGKSPVWYPGILWVEKDLEDLTRDWLFTDETQKLYKGFWDRGLPLMRS